MQVALWNMMIKSNDRYIPNNRQYEKIKQDMAQAISILNKGKESKLKGIPKLTPAWNKGLTGIYAPETIKKMSKPKTETTKNKIRESIIKKFKDKGIMARPKIKFVLRNILTNKIIETTNLKKWCKDNNVNHVKIYKNRSMWKIIEKFKLKDNSKIL
jgi:hypothetical protein